MNITLVQKLDLFWRMKIPLKSDQTLDLALFFCANGPTSLNEKPCHNVFVHLKRALSFGVKHRNTLKLSNKARFCQPNYRIQMNISATDMKVSFLILGTLHILDMTGCFQTSNCVIHPVYNKVWYPHFILWFSPIILDTGWITQYTHVGCVI